MTKLKTTMIPFLLLLSLLSAAARRDSDAFSAELKHSNGKPNKGGGSGGGNDGGGMGGFFGPGGGFGIPGFENGWGNGVAGGGGYGAGYGGPTGGYSKGGVVRPTVVCKEKGPCYKKKVTCPAKCFTSYSRSGKNSGAGGGGGSCTVDCKKKCFAYC